MKVISKIVKNIDISRKLVWKNAVLNDTWQSSYILGGTSSRKGHCEESKENIGIEGPS